MSNEKQIEEMAKRIYIATDLYYIECIKIASYLFEKDNCRIIDNENEIVISKEEYENLKKELKDMEKQRDEQAYITEELIQDKHLWIEQVRKETVKKLINDFIALCKKKKEEKFKIGGYDRYPYEKGVNEMCKELIDAVKKFDVDLGEKNE